MGKNQNPLHNPPSPPRTPDTLLVTSGYFEGCISDYINQWLFVYRVTLFLLSSNISQTLTEKFWTFCTQNTKNYPVIKILLAFRYSSCGKCTLKTPKDTLKTLQFYDVVLMFKENWNSDVWNISLFHAIFAFNRYYWS